MTVPFRYEVFRNMVGHDEEVLIRAVDADGLFAREVLPARELLVFRGVPPETAERFGEVTSLEVYDGPHRLQAWTLKDVQVHAVTQEDVFVSASLLCPFGSYHSLPGDVSYRLRGPGIPEARCSSIDGFPVNGLDHDICWPPVRLIGCEITATTRNVIARPHLWERYAEYLRAVDVHGEELASMPFGLDITDVQRSPLRAGLLDITFAQTGHLVSERTFPRVGWRPVWELWREGVPTEPNLWTGYDTEGRWAWLEVLRCTHDRPEGWSGGGVFHVDGRYVTDTPGLYLALNEGLTGPGLRFRPDCGDTRKHPHLCCDPPGDITVVWQHSDIARYAVREDFDRAVEMVRRHVNLVLD